MEKRKLIIVGQEAGGVGKTVTAMHLAEIYREAGHTLIVLDADDKNRIKTGSALAHALPHHTVTWLGTGPTLEEMEADPDRGNAHFDKVRTVLDHHSVLLDLGANVVQRLLEYAVRMRAARRWAEDGIEVEFWVPMLSDKISIEAGVKALSAAGKAFGTSAIRGVRNLRDGDFSGWAGTPQGDVLAALEKAGVVMLDLPKAPIPSEGLKAMKRGPWSPGQIVEMGWAATAEALGLDKRVAERTFYGCQDWAESVGKAWGHVVPEGNG